MTPVKITKRYMTQKQKEQNYSLKCLRKRSVSCNQTGEQFDKSEEQYSSCHVLWQMLMVLHKKREQEQLDTETAEPLQRCHFFCYSARLDTTNCHN